VTGSSFKKISLVGCVILIVFSLSACLRSSSTSTQTSGSFLPPTVIPSATSLPPTDVPKPTKPANCTNALTYMEDITIPDGTEVQPGQELDKRWQVRNNGTCDWDDKYTLKLIAGGAMGSPDTQALYPARSGSAAVIRVVLKAPTEPATYRSAWQAFDGNDTAFGDPVYIEIIVKEEKSTATPES
jgi:hypothetical protein